MTGINNPNTPDNRQLQSSDLIAAARKLWGKETRRGKVEWRFGAKGSKSILLDHLVWFDHETGEGGGIVDLCQKAGINGAFHKPSPRSTTAKEQKRETWEPSLAPPEPAPINMLTCDTLFTYRAADGTPTHYVRRFEHPRRFLPLTFGRLNGVIGWHCKAPKPPLPLYGLEQLLNNPDLVILCEGEKAADAAFRKITDEDLPWAAMSWYGGAARARHADVTPLAGRKVVVWPDADTAGLKARDTLLEIIEGSAAAALNVEGLPQSFDAADLKAEDSIKTFVEARTRPPKTDTGPPKTDTGPPKTKTRSGKDLPANVKREDFFAIMPQNLYVYIPTLEFWPATVIDKRIAKKTSTWICQKRGVEQVTWAPGEPQIIVDKIVSKGGFIEGPGNRIFNLYLAPQQSGSNGDVQPWLNHIMLIYPDDWQHIVHWCAHAVQYPDIKINHALVLGGNMGVGKDTMIEPLRRAVGHWNFHDVSPQRMLGQFNGFLKSRVLRINEARDLGESDRFKFYDHMKTLLATPPFVIEINEKNLKEYLIPNLINIIITTNYKADGIFLPADDRRHYVAWSQTTRDDFTPDYWNELWGWYENGGFESVAKYLAAFDLSGFDPKAPPIQTRAFWDIADASRAPEDGELADVIDLLGNPDALTLADLVRMAQGEILAWLNDRKNRRAIPHRLEKAGYVPVRHDIRKDGLWIVNSERKVVYAKINLPIRDQISAARRLGAQ